MQYPTHPKQHINSVILALLFPLTIFGYSTVAPLMNKFAPEGALTSIVFRGLVLLLCFAAVQYYQLKSSRQRNILLFPMFLFLGMYALRLADNYYIQQLPMYAPPLLIFSILFGSGILPSIVLARGVDRISERSFIIAMTLMIAVFFVGLVVNLDAVIGMLAERSGNTMLSKLNAISLSSVAASYALFLIVMGKTSPKSPPIMTVLHISIILLLLGIVIISRSRGPILGMLGALLVYLFFISGQHKKYVIRILVVVAVIVTAATAYSGLDFIGMATERFIDDGSQYSIGSEIRNRTGRLGQWVQSWNDFLDYPIIGNKVYEGWTLFYPHNIIMESLISLGIIGTVVLLLSLFIVAKSSIRLLRNRHSSLLERFSALIFFKILIENQFSGAIWGTTLWIASACVIGLVVANTQKQRKRRSRSVNATDPRFQ